MSTDVVRSTAAANLSSNEIPGGVDAAVMAQIESELAELPKLIAGGTPPEKVAEIVFDGLREGRRYIYTDMEHTLCAIDDRVEQLKAGGLTSSFKRRMEAVVKSELERSA